MSEKDLVWLPIALAKKVNDLAGESGIEKEILSYIEETKLDLRTSVEEIDESILVYRAKMIQARDAFKKAKDEELEANYKLWENYSEEIKTTGEYIKEAQNIIKGLTSEVQELNRAFSSLNVDRALGFLTVLKDIQYFTNSEKKLVSFLFANYKKEGD